MMKFALRAGLGVLAATAAALVFVPSASAAPVDINFDCQASTPIGDQPANIAQTVEATAPATAAPGSALDVVVDPAPGTVPSDVNGNTIKRIHTFVLKVPVPTNSTLTSVDLTGGSGLGDTPPEWSEAGGVVTISFEGPIAGGATYELPTVTAHLTAGASGTIDSSLYGTSFDDPGLTFTAVVGSIIGDISAPTSCFPNPSPVLTSTTIG
jgi:dehydratase